MNLIQLIIENEASMLAFGAKLAKSLPDTAIIFLEGNLGAGKTTLVRGMLQGLGFNGAVKSPTYTLVEPYEVDGQQIFHFDLYRVRDPEELEFIGISDYFMTGAICLIEWPQLGADFLPQADITCYIETYAEGRKIRLDAHSENGTTILKRLNNGN